MSLEVERRFTVRWHYKDEYASSTRTREFTTLDEAMSYYSSLGTYVTRRSDDIAASLWETTKVASK